jgi:hypothetical protein
MNNSTILYQRCLTFDWVYHYDVLQIPIEGPDRSRVTMIVSYPPMSSLQLRVAGKLRDIAGPAANCDIKEGPCEARPHTFMMSYFSSRAVTYQYIAHLFIPATALSEKILIRGYPPFYMIHYMQSASSMPDRVTFSIIQYLTEAHRRSRQNKSQSI